MFQHWDEEGDDARVFDASSGNTASARDRHLANSECEIFDLFVNGGHSKDYAAAMIEFMRCPCTQEGDWTLVKGGVAITTYMDELTEKGL